MEKILTIEQKEVVDELKNRYGINFNGFTFEIQPGHEYDYYICIQPEKGFDQYVDIDPFLPESLKGKIDDYAECVFAFDGDQDFFANELENTGFFRKFILKNQ